MKRVTARTVDTFVTPDKTEITNLQKRQKQVASAFESLGVFVRQNVRNDALQTKAANKADAAARKAELKAAEKQAAAELKLNKQAAKAKIKLFVSDASQEQNRFTDFDGMKENQYYRNALNSIEAVGDGNERALLLQQLNDDTNVVLQKHGQAVAREDNITAFGSVMADALQVEYDASDINRLVDEHKLALGDDTLPSAARIAIATEEMGAIDALLGRDDLHPTTIASLNSAKERIETAQAREVQEDKTRIYEQIKLADALEDRSEKQEALVNILSNHDDQLTDGQRGGMIADIKILAQELRTENLAKLSIGNVSTKALADPENLPAGFKSLPLSEIRKIQDRQFTEALSEGNLSRISLLTRDPTDLPSAAKDYFGSFMSDVKSADFNDLSQNITNRWEQAKTLESIMGPATMEKLLGAADYSKYQILSGIGSQEGLPTAVSRLQDYEASIANGRPLAPEGFAQMKRDVEQDVIDDLADVPWSFFDRDVNETEVRQSLTPYFKVWGAMGLTQSQMTERAKATLGRTTWEGMVGGGLAQKHFQAVQADTDGPIYEETPEELFQSAVKLQAQRFRELQPGLPEELSVRALGVDKSKIVFSSPDGIPIANSVISLDALSKLVKENTPTIKQRVLMDRTESQKSPAQRRRDSR